MFELKICLVKNREGVEICRMRLVHGFRSRKAMAGVNESLKSALQTMRQMAKFAPKFLSVALRYISVQSGHGITVLNLQRLTTAGSENSSVLNFANFEKSQNFAILT